MNPLTGGCADADHRRRSCSGCRPASRASAVADRRRRLQRGRRRAARRIDRRTTASRSAPRDISSCRRGTLLRSRGSERCVLFSFSDRPVHEALGHAARRIPARMNASITGTTCHERSISSSRPGHRRPARRRQRLSAFPVRRIYCVGRNYAAHAREMGFDRTASRPSSSASRPTPIVVPVPDGADRRASPTRRDRRTTTTRSNWWSRIGKGGENIAVDDALDAHLRLRRRPGHDAARPADGDARTRAARGKSARPSTSPRRSARLHPRRGHGHLERRRRSALKVNGRPPEQRRRAS